MHKLIETLKEIKPEYYKTSQESLREKEGFFYNLFIMKNKDFFQNYSFINDIHLSQYDAYQMKLEGFLSERLSNFFSNIISKKIKIFPSAAIDNFSVIIEESKTIIN